MDAMQSMLLTFLADNQQLSIPIYQRRYRWNIEQCEQLWEDIIKVGEKGKNNPDTHFIGSVVYMSSGANFAAVIPKRLIIDGQQRITTVTLLISALAMFLKENPILEDADSEDLLFYYLSNSKAKGEEKYKIILNDEDKNTVKKIIDNISSPEEISFDNDKDSLRIIENFKYFKNRINKSNVNSLYIGLLKLVIIQISLEYGKDNPQLIFESLNSTGLELNKADLIRNYILMGLEPEEQIDIYNKYWEDMDKGFENTNYFDLFIRDYLTIKLHRIPVMYKVYSEFKNYSKNWDNIEDLVKDISKYSKYFFSIALDKDSDKDIQNAFKNFNELQVNTSHPFLLQVYKDYDEKVITKEELLKIINIIESYVLRRIICEIPTNSLNKTFAFLYEEIDLENYVESLEIALYKRKTYKRFPNNEEFKKDFITKDIYNMRNRNYILSNLENYGYKEFVNVEEYTIEHILPQNPKLSKEWKEDLGVNWREIQEKYLHTIGNLTLTGYNPELSDLPFKNKRDMEPGGFKQSPIKLNQHLTNLDKWNEETIQERAEILFNKALEIWPYPEFDDEILNSIRESETAEIVYQISDHKFLTEGAPLHTLFIELERRIMNIDASVNEEAHKLYIAYKAINNFASIIGRKNSIRIVLNIPYKEIEDPQGICEDITKKGHWGIGDTQFRIKNMQNIDYALNLITQAFDYNMEN